MVNPIPQTHASNTGDLEGAVLPAGKDTVLIKPEGIPPALMAELIMQDIGALELATLSRSDSIMGERLVYSPIFNLSRSAIEYNPKNITTPGKIRSQSSINLWRHLVDEEPVIEKDGVIEVTLRDLPAGYLVEISMGIHGETVFFSVV